MPAPIPKTVGTPVNQSTPIADWTTDDLSDFIRNHIAGLPPEALPQSSSWDTIKVGTMHLSDTGIIKYPGMQAVVVSAAGGPGFTAPWQDSTVAGHPPVQFSRDPFRWVHLRGMAEMSGIGTPSGTIFNLPPGYRPDKTLQQVVYTVDITAGGTTGQQGLLIDSSGNVSVPAFGGTDARRVFFDSVKFPITSNS